MDIGFLQGTLGRTGLPVHRLGLSASNWPGARTVERALDEGINYCFSFGFDRQMVRVLRTDWIDVFHFLGVLKPKETAPSVLDQLARLREDPRVTAISISCYDRKYAGQLAEAGALDCLMIRYNAEHRGAETDVFPYLVAHDAGLVSYTATRWTCLLRRSRHWPRDRPIPTPGQAYRFVLTNPHADVCLTAPRNERELMENLSAVSQGTLPEDEMVFMRTYGDVVHEHAGWFM